MIPIRDTAPCHSRPLVTWGLMAICITVFVSMKLMPDQMSYRLLNLYGMVPIRYTNPYYGLPFDGYLSFLTSLFLHGNWLHLIMNMWFLWIFGDNVEDRMGRLPFLIFYLVCGLLATFLQWFFDPELAIPVVGASGAIAGVLAAYFFLYPLERVVVWVPLFFLPIVIHIPAIAFLGLWVLVQLHSATTAMLFEGTAVDVAWWAHLGGFIAGTILYRLFLRKDQAEKNELI
ncbi:MAG: rhomboid family intramembrane serine protease [Methylobacter tundripaludum]|uniref:Membrane associated rhomboid family serine protease n=1 Tax=Methylobacter tundripaludum TaxID=173365 RepID=A0A2S6GRD0_9GAMM|nr:rhomboid family intramembrane serine protease [Methylobacter tundripaludum]MCK9635848.1 rhomboid family intramembrane serine protease [Methylobacter tundripaludum]PPK67749.1 membrane associated rhomboid family serine protease [Methylobacter tundripaludum]